MKIITPNTCRTRDATSADVVAAPTGRTVVGITTDRVNVTLGFPAPTAPSLPGHGETAPHGIPRYVPLVTHPFTAFDQIPWTSYLTPAIV